jgi:hypothetical protein
LSRKENRMHGHELIDMLMSMAVAMFGTGLVISQVLYRRARERIHDLEREIRGHTPALEETTDPGDVSRQLESLAAQVDRLAEGQEFLSRVLADRAAGRHLPAPEDDRIATPP